MMSRLLQAIIVNPDDAGPKLELADEIEEEGGDPHLVTGLRWCAENGKWPFRPRDVRDVVEYPNWTWVYPGNNPEHYAALPGYLDMRIISRHAIGWVSTDSLVLVRRLGEVLTDDD